MLEKIVYFDAPGKEHTIEVLKLAKERAFARQIGKIVLASTRGDTARLALETFKDTDIKLIVVPHAFGFGESQRFPRELVSELEAKGHEVHFGTLLFHTESFYESRTPTAMANLLRVFSQGIKVCVEIVLIAADGGCVSSGERVVAVAGTARCRPDDR